MAAIKIGELLISKGIITEKQLHVAIRQQKITGLLLGDTLIRLGFMSSVEMAMTLSEQAGIEFFNLLEFQVSEEALHLVSRNMAEGVGFIPLSVKDNVLSIGITNPSNIHAIDTATKITGKPPKVFMVDSESFYETMDQAYYFLENPIQTKIMEIISTIKKDMSSVSTVAAPLLDLLLKEGIRRNSTDIHITPSSDAIHLFFRIDGVLQNVYCLPMEVKNGLISRLKILSELDIAEQRLPQDGSFSFSFFNKKYDMRVSMIPSIYGENAVIRILSGTGSLITLSGLGFDEKDTEKLKDYFAKPYGVILVAGPTGSGKTTTLYAALRNINFLEKNVTTIEDPVEYKLSLVRQTSVSKKSGYDFALAGRSFMRQDPDVILLGEVRDEETAKIAIRASITGHMVLSTIHTNDAATAIPRLIDLGIDRFMLSSALLAVVAQRLVRKICTNCKEEYPITPDERRRLMSGSNNQIAETAFRGAGCSLCSHTGYTGRTVVGELLLVDDEIEELIFSGASVKRIRDAAREKGMKTIRENAIIKANAGITSIEEVLRNTK